MADAMNRHSDRSIPPSSRRPDGRRRPRIALQERPDCYELLVHLPGGTGAEVKVGLEAGVLTIRSKAGVPAPDGGVEGLEAPAPLAGWQLSVDFGDLVAGDELCAVYEGGSLFVSLPKPAPLRPGLGCPGDRSA
jgi:HSP20 family molecular chaperone IbpA